MHCIRCGSPVRENSKFKECSKCRRICPECGNKKDLFAVACRICRRRRAEENALGGTPTWYLSKEEKEEQKERVRRGLMERQSR